MVIIGADHADSGQILLKTRAHNDPFPAGCQSPGHRVRARGTQDPRHPRRLLDQAEHHDLRPQAHRHGRPFPRGGPETASAKEYVTDLGVKTSSVHEKIRNLSGGNQQKVVIARCLFTHPDLIIFDEPTQGIDVGAKADVYRLIYEFVDQGGAAIVISSELPELIRVSDRIAVMREGSIVGELQSTGRDEVATETSELGEHIISVGHSWRSSSSMSTFQRSSRLLAIDGVAVSVVFLAMVIYFSVASPAFLTGDNIYNTFVESISTVLLAAGLTFVLISGGIDLSIGSTSG